MTPGFDGLDLIGVLVALAAIYALYRYEGRQR